MDFIYVKLTFYRHKVADKVSVMHVIQEFTIYMYVTHNFLLLLSAILGVCYYLPY